MISVNLTVQQLKKIVEEAEENMKNTPFADDILTLQVEPYHIRVTQPVQNEPMGGTVQCELFSKKINTSYSK